MSIEKATIIVRDFFIKTKDSSEFALTPEFIKAREVIGHELVQKIYNQVNN